jgi:hypothetical protein
MERRKNYEFAEECWLMFITAATVRGIGQKTLYRLMYAGYC